MGTPSLYVSAVAATAVIASVKQVGECAVPPHAVNKCDKDGRTASRKNALNAVTAGACRKK